MVQALLIASFIGAGYSGGSARNVPFGNGKGDKWGRKIAQEANRRLRTTGRLHRRDCSGLVVTVLTHVGLRLDGNTRTLYHSAKREGRLRKKPRLGDLVFFDRTWDSNRNGRVDDTLTHVAIVTSIEKDGTVVMVHRGSRGVATLRMNLNHKHERRKDKRVLNDYLRSPSYGTAKDPRLAGELFRAFARPPRRSH